MFIIEARGNNLVKGHKKKKKINRQRINLCYNVEISNLFNT